jgi:hypothetical protein
MEVGNNELTEYRYWDVNDVVTRIWSLLPRRRWITLNTNCFGPLFSACDLLGIPLSVIQWLLRSSLRRTRTFQRQVVRQLRQLANSETVRAKLLGLGALKSWPFKTILGVASAVLGMIA